MKKNFWMIALVLPLVLAGCRGRRGSEAPVPETVVEETVPAGEGNPFRPVFSSSPIPEAVADRMRGVSYPSDAQIPLDELRYLRLSYVDFDGREQVGEMVCNQAIADDLLTVFRALFEARYPIRSIRLIDDFGGSDEASMQADNTSCFNYRKISGMKRLSKHALGLAVDINPKENPYVRSSGVQPSGSEEFANRSKSFPHKIDREDLCYRLFRKQDFSWGGAWQSVKDYQHFEK